jgi:cell cycle checkpoint control protein RAD9A
VEKTVEKCEFLIIHPTPGAVLDGQGEHDSLESTLTVRLHCHHGEQIRSPKLARRLTNKDKGVIKTHRLLLNEPDSLVAPSVPESEQVSHVTLPARTIKDMLDHFPASRGSGDPQLVWTFDDTEVSVRSFELGADSRGQCTGMT